MTYRLFDPTGNITALVTELTAQKDRALTASKVMACEPSVEQVGFYLPEVSGFDAGLEMAGGEFCGNASMSAAALTAIEAGVKPGEKRTVCLKVSGADGPVGVNLEALTESSFKGRVAMPKALAIRQETIPGTDLTAPVVFLPGIAHALVPEGFGLEEAEKRLPLMCRDLGLEAMGMMLINEEKETLTPLVYVKEVGTLVRENSCASGTASAGAFLAQREGRTVRQTFTEPGGCLTVEAHPDGRLFIEGRVTLLK